MLGQIPHRRPGPLAETNVHRQLDVTVLRPLNPLSDTVLEEEIALITIRFILHKCQEEVEPVPTFRIWDISKCRMSIQTALLDQRNRQHGLADL